MTAIIYIKSKLEGDIFGRFIGVYLSPEKKITVETSECVDRRAVRELNFCDEAVVNDEATKVEVGYFYYVECLISMYANNPIAPIGIILTVTKILNKGAFKREI